MEFLGLFSFKIYTLLKKNFDFFELRCLIESLIVEDNKEASYGLIRFVKSAETRL
jgi:hypothetical protein